MFCRISYQSIFYIYLVGFMFYIVCRLRGVTNLYVSTEEPRYNEGPRDWQNMLAITRFRYIKVLLQIFYYYWSKENRSLYRGCRCIEVR